MIAPALAMCYSVSSHGMQYKRLIERTNSRYGKDQPWNKARPLTDVAARLRRAVSYSYDSLVFASQSMQASTLFEEDESAWCARIVQKWQGALRGAFRTRSDSTAEPCRYLGARFRQVRALSFSTFLWVS